MNSRKWTLSSLYLGAVIVIVLILNACQPIMPEEMVASTTFPEIPGEVLIPAGTFEMGCEPENRCPDYELPLHTVYLDAFYIDKFEVTNDRYQACVEAGACEPPRTGQSLTRSEYFGAPEYANYPVVEVDWFQADAFCKWDGKRLPTEAEWMKAARGADDVRRYPWGGDSPTCELVNYWEGSDGCVGDTIEVGSLPAGASPYGVMNMAGNITEWVNDWYDRDYYSVSPSENPPGPAEGSEKTMMGGSYMQDGSKTQVAFRLAVSPYFKLYENGFRCAHSP